jgi:hypothetical protein
MPESVAMAAGHRGCKRKKCDRCHGGGAHHDLLEFRHCLLLIRGVTINATIALYLMQRNGTVPYLLGPADAPTLLSTANCQQSTILLK